MESMKNNWIDLGNLAIGVGTIFIAIAVLIVNTRSTNRNRLVHLADKRQDWVNRLTDLVSEYTSLHMFIDANEGKIEAPEWREKVNRLSTLMTSIILMLDPNDSVQQSVIEKIATITKPKSTRGGLVASKIHSEIFVAVQSIIAVKRRQIEKLEE